MLTVLLTVGIFVLSNALLRPAVSSLISKRAPGGQGVALGLNNAFMSLGRIFGPIWAGAVFDIKNTLPYLSGSLVMFIGFLLSMAKVEDRKNQPQMSDQLSIKGQIPSTSGSDLTHTDSH